jgi:4-amino-4-deoxy-L-arabinose transferase-like glycosyltransferase
VGIDNVGLKRWARARVPELCALGVGVLIRLSMALTYDARIGYDFVAHWPTIQYIARQHALPPFNLNTASAHPPLYYVIAAALVALGLDAGALGWLAALWGIARLVVIWAALEKWLPESRLARVAALAIAAVLPAAAHLDGMVTNEALGMLLAAIALLLVPSAIAGARTGRIAPMIRLAVVLGLAVLTKLTALILIVSVAAAVGLEILRAPSRVRALRVRLAPALLGVVVLAAMTSWYFARNVELTGQLAPTAFEGSQKINQAEFDRIPYFDRRPPAFYFAWTPGIYLHPLYPTGLKPKPRFWPVLVASTFNDYYIFSYSGGGKYNQPRWVSAAGVTLGALSVAGGTGIALVTVIAWFGAFRRLWRRREDGEPDPRLALLIAPLLALIGLVHFVTKYPNDNFGPVKGTYLQFTAPVLCALFGVGVAWMWRQGRKGWRAAAVIALGGLALVAAYSLHARFPPLGKDANGAAPFFAHSEPSKGSEPPAMSSARRSRPTLDAAPRDGAGRAK